MKFSRSLLPILLALAAPQLCGKGFGYPSADPLSMSNLANVLMRQPEATGYRRHRPPDACRLCELCFDGCKIHGGYQLSLVLERGLYAEPLMDVNKKTRLRVNTEARPEIARALRDARKRLGLTQSELAEALGNSQGAITRWERAIDSPPISALLAMAKLVGDQDRAFWLNAAGVSMPEQTAQDSDIRRVPLLRDAAAAGTPRAIEEHEIERMLALPASWLPKGGHLFAVKVSGDSMEPIILDGHIVLIDTEQRDIKSLVGKMVAARQAGDGVTIKWLRKDEDIYLLVPQHVSPKFPVKVIREHNGWSIVGAVVKWIGEPPPIRK